MFNRFCFGALLLACLAVPFTGCNNSSSGLDSISISPNTDLQLVVGNSATIQLTVTGTYGNAKHPTTGPVTNVTWASALPAVATVSSSGLVSAGVTSGYTSITATAQGFNGPVTSSVEVTVTGGTASTSTSVVSLAIIPTTQTVAAPPDTSQFIAIGTTSSGATLDLSSQSTWSSSSVQIATVGSPEKTGTVPGLATAVSQGSVTVTALYTNSVSLTVVAGSATFTVTSGGGAQAVTALSITPGSESLSASGGTGQFIALATYGSSGLVEDVTNSTQLTWTSSIPTYASISSGLFSGNGVVKGVSAGSAVITAEWTNPASGSTPASVVTATATVTVTSTAAPEPLLSLTILPSSLSVDDLQGTGQFLAIGTFSTSPYVRDLTDSVTWISSFPNIFPVDTNTGGNTGASAGIVTAYGNGETTIIAEASSADGTIQTATATFSCPLVMPCPCSVAEGCNPPVTTCTTPVLGSCFPGSQASSLLSTVTIYNEGVNTTNWLVTASSATGTPDVIHCGPGWALSGGTGGSVCVATYPNGTTVTLTATQPAGSTGTFGGWSSNCTTAPGGSINPNPPTATGPNTCTLNLSALQTQPTNETVGVIFN